MKITTTLIKHKFYYLTGNKKYKKCKSKYILRINFNLTGSYFINKMSARHWKFRSLLINTSQKSSIEKLQRLLQFTLWINQLMIKWTKIVLSSVIYQLGNKCRCLFQNQKIYCRFNQNRTHFPHQNKTRKVFCKIDSGRKHNLESRDINNRWIMKCHKFRWPKIKIICFRSINRLS